MTQSAKYDLFISYADADKAWVEGYLLDSFRQADIRYYSEAAFTLGVPRLKEFENAIQCSHRTLVIISPAYLVDNFKEFIDLLGQNYGLETATWPVIPLILHPVKLPPRLAMLTHLDATEESQWSEVIERLCADLQRPVPLVPSKPECPYPGMIPFGESNSDRFFGREQEVEHLLEHLYRHRFITVIGSSGSGKSSLIFAGLIPKLRQSRRFGSGEWLVCTMRPGENPLSLLKTTLGSEQADLSLAITEALNTQPNVQRLLLVIDQYEELFTIAGTEKEEFQQALLKWLKISNCYLILTVRADFYADLMQCSLWENIQLHRLEIVPLDEIGLEKAIFKPADNVGVFIESALVERLIKDAIGEPGILPLIQETLVLLWEKLERRFLPLKAYEALVLSRKDYTTLGNNKRTGLQVAIARRADAALTDLNQENKELGAIARRIFLRLVQFGEGRADTRRQQPVNALGAGNDAQLFDKTLSHLVNCRLLTLSSEEDSTPKVDIAHEALISGWPTLQQWLIERREAELTRRRLEAKAQEWERLGKTSGGLLDEVQLAEAQGWLNSPDATELGIDPNISALVQTSYKAIQRELEQQKKVNRILIIFIIMLSGLFLFALNQTINANIKTIESQSASSKAKFTSGEQLEALTASIEAGKLLKWTPFVPLNIKQQVLQTFQQIVYENREINRLEGHTNWVNGVSFNNDGTMLASASDDRTVKIWSLKGEEIIKIAHDNIVYDVSFSSQGNILASVSEDKKVRLWDSKGKLLREFPTLKSPALNVNFSPDGQKIAFNSKDGTFLSNLEGKQLKFLPNVNSWTMSVRFSPDSQLILCPGKNYTVEILTLDGKLISILQGHKDLIYIANFSSDGKILATASEDTTVKIWNRNGSLIKTLPHYQPITWVTFSRNDRMLISGTKDGTINLWNAKNGELIQKWKAHVGNITDIKVSPDGKIIASSGIDNTVKLWNIEGNYLGRHNDRVRSIDFSPDGKSIVSASADKSIKIWDLNGKLLQNFTRHIDKVWAVNFSPNGKSIVSASADKSIKIWDLNGKLLQTLQEHKDEVKTVKFSPDGKTLATASADKTVKIWSVDGQLLKTFNAHNDIINRLSFSPDGKTIATASNDTTVKLWTLDGNLLTTLGGHKDFVHDVSFSPDGKIIASTSEDNTIKLWNRDGKLLRTLTGHKGVVWTVSFSPDGKMIASSSNDMTIKLWNLEGEQLATFQSNSYIFSLSFSPDSKKIVSGDFDGVVALWNLDLDNLLKRGCSQLRPYLSSQSKKNDYDKLCKE
ncbi:toll/interleukin-1 receptor domain-containing protein [Scytonema sp. NUACC26]|uniref:toll/interleukin-1 receptor domain-containing protein n=1 Tax=Scytonema sp. NUACC26 TaxID=3140176 RepID=UPI0034DC02B1